MHVIDTHQPCFMYRLHNAKFGGVWYAVSDPCEPLYETFQAIPGWFGIPLELGQTESNKNDEVAPAIYYDAKTFEDWYDEAEAAGKNPAKMRNYGITPGDYARRRHNTFGLVVEPGYWTTPEADDDTSTNLNYRAVISERLDAEDDIEGWIEQKLADLDGDLRLDTRTRRFLQEASAGQKTRRQQQRQWAEASEDLYRPATEAEVFGNRVTRRFKLGAQAAMLARVMEEEIAEGNTHPARPRIRDQALERLEQWGQSIGSRLVTVPIRDLVGVQLCAGLATAAYLRDNRSQ